MAVDNDLDWLSVKFLFYDTGSNAKNNLDTLLKFIDQRFVCFVSLNYCFFCDYFTLLLVTKFCILNNVDCIIFT